MILRDFNLSTPKAPNPTPKPKPQALNLTYKAKRLTLRVHVPVEYITCFGNPKP